jgi:outer membrane immunogenic protein
MRVRRFMGEPCPALRHSFRLMPWEANMRIFLGAVLSLAMTSIAFAADFYTARAPLATSWAGPYLGGTLGYEWGTIDNNPTKPSGVTGGIEAGYNWQNGNFVFGGETDFQLSGAEDTFAPWQFSNPWFGTVRGRGGVTIGNVLVFGTVGLAYGSLTATTPGNLSETHDGIGWVGGAGVEVGLTPRWSAKAEWLYLDLSDHAYSVTGANNGLTANLLRMGVNYHF